jgi:ubiquinone/menaquinone biosynthesis C-methylase UbiE
MEPVWRLNETSTSNNSILDYYEVMSSTFDDVYFARGKFADTPWNELSLELAEVAETVSRVQANSIADVGCGTGHWSRLFANRCPEIHLIDSSPSMLELAQSKFECMGLPKAAKFWVGDILQEPVAGLYPPNIDVSILGFVLSHYAELEVTRILANVAARSERVLIIDSTTSESLSPRKQYKEHYVNGRWHSVMKRYETLDHWLSVLSRCRLAPEVLAHTKHFFAIISSKV